VAKRVRNTEFIVPHYISPKDYLDIERESEIRHEYRYGLVYAMAGGTDNHDRITFNLLKVIDNHFGDSSECRFYSGNVKVNDQDKLYYYPDAFVTCDPRDRNDRYIKRYPKLKYSQQVQKSLMGERNLWIINKLNPWKSMF
jgi:Uma2 family endonuclease